MSTVCTKCKNLFVVNKSDQWYRWLCMAKKREQEFNPVTGDTVADPPYELCRYINYGGCIHYEAGVNSLSPIFEEEPNV